MNLMFFTSHASGAQAARRTPGTFMASKLSEKTESNTKIILSSVSVLVALFFGLDQYISHKISKESPYLLERKAISAELDVIKKSIEKIDGNVESIYRDASENIKVLTGAVNELKVTVEVLRKAVEVAGK